MVVAGVGGDGSIVIAGGGGFGSIVVAGSDGDGDGVDGSIVIAGGGGSGAIVIAGGGGGGPPTAPGVEGPDPPGGDGDVPPPPPPPPQAASSRNNITESSIFHAESFKLGIQPVFHIASSRHKAPGLVITPHISICSRIASQPSLAEDLTMESGMTARLPTLRGNCTSGRFALVFASLCCTRKPLRDLTMPPSRPKRARHPGCYRPPPPSLPRQEDTPTNAPGILALTAQWIIHPTPQL